MLAIRTRRSRDVIVLVVGMPTLRNADLGGLDLRRALLRGFDLRDASLAGANLTNADLGGADLRGADLRGATLACVSVCGTFFDGRTQWPEGFDAAEAGAHHLATDAPHVQVGNEELHARNRGEALRARFLRERSLDTATRSQMLLVRALQVCGEARRIGCRQDVVSDAGEPAGDPPEHDGDESALEDASPVMRAAL